MGPHDAHGVTRAGSDDAAIPASAEPTPALLASRAAQRSGCQIRVLTGLRELEAAETLINQTWDGGSAEISIGILRALSKAGNFVSGAYDGSTLVGACVGFFGSAGRSELHSHLAAVAPAHRGRGIGLAMKLHQRAWGIDTGVETISWTYDPLVSRNAHVNVTKLGAVPVEYLENFYGTGGGLVPAEPPTDRVLVAWRLASESVRLACRGGAAGPDLAALRKAGASVLVAPDGQGAPIETADSGHRFALVGVPHDIDAIRGTAPPLAHAWREAMLRHLGHSLRAGHRVVGYADDHYVLDRGTSDETARPR